MSNTPVPVSIAGDVTWGPSLHAYYPPDVFDMSAPMDWPVGRGTGQHVLAGNVFHRAQAVVLDGHDLGLLLPHVGEEALARLNSSRKPIWSASTVRACGKPIACLGGPKLLTMMLCGAPFKFAAGVNDSNHHYNVFVGMSDLDYFKGWVSVGAEFVKDAIGFALSVSGAKSSTGVDVYGLLGGKDPVGAFADAVVDLGASAIVSGYSGWEEPIGAKFTLGHPVANVSLEAKWKVDGPLGLAELVTGVPVTGLAGERRPELVEAGAQRRTPVSTQDARWTQGKGFETSSTWVEL